MTMVVDKSYQIISQVLSNPPLIINSRVADQQLLQASGRLAGNDVTRVIIPFKDQDSANVLTLWVAPPEMFCNWYRI